MVYDFAFCVLRSEKTLCFASIRKNLKGLELIVRLLLIVYIRLFKNA